MLEWVSLEEYITRFRIWVQKKRRKHNDQRLAWCFWNTAWRSRTKPYVTKEHSHFPSRKQGPTGRWRGAKAGLGAAEANHHTQSISSILGASPTVPRCDFAIECWALTICFTLSPRYWKMALPSSSEPYAHRLDSHIAMLLKKRLKTISKCCIFEKKVAF